MYKPYTPQLVTGCKGKVPIYPRFSAAKICREHLKITDMIGLMAAFFAAVNSTNAEGCKIKDTPKIDIFAVLKYKTNRELFKTSSVFRCYYFII